MTNVILSFNHKAINAGDCTVLIHGLRIVSEDTESAYVDAFDIEIMDEGFVDFRLDSLRNKLYAALRAAPRRMLPAALQSDRLTEWWQNLVGYPPDAYHVFCATQEELLDAIKYVNLVEGTFGLDVRITCVARIASKCTSKWRVWEAIDCEVIP